MGRVRLGCLTPYPGTPPVSPGLRRMNSKNRDLIDRLQTSASWTTPEEIVYICLVSTADICPVSAADICPVSTADICPVSTEDIYLVSTEDIYPVEAKNITFGAKWVENRPFGLKLGPNES